MVSHNRSTARVRVDFSQDLLQQASDWSGEWFPAAALRPYDPDGPDQVTDKHFSSSGVTPINFPHAD